MNIVVTGGMGYLGAVLVPMLLARGDKVTIYDLFMWGINPILHVANHPNLTLVRADVRDTAQLAPHVKKADAVVNLAAIVGFPACAENPNEARTINRDAVRTLAGMLGKGQILVHASTGSTYGSVDGICTEDTPIAPLTLYGETKADAEKFVIDVAGIPLRFATVFGISPRLRLDLLVNDIVNQAIHNKAFIMFEGHARRTFIHSSDAAKSVLFAIDHHREMQGKPYNIGSEDLNYTKLEIAEMIQKQAPFYLHQAEIAQDKDKRDYAVSYDRIRALGFTTTVSMEDGIRELVKVCPVVKERSNFRAV